jgi:curved DNA-binding protein CbpA
MTTVNGAPPTAQGVLDQVPFVHLLVYMAEKRLTGTIVLTPPNTIQGDQSLIHFANGEVTQTRLAGGIATVEQCTSLVAATTFAFFDGVNLLPSKEKAGATRDPLATIWSAVRARGVDRVVETTLGRLGPKVLKLHDESRPERFGFDPGELGFVATLRARPCALGELLSTGSIPATSIKLVVYALLVTRHIDHGSAPPIGLARPGERDNEKADATPASGSHVAIARVKLATKRAEAERAPSSSRTPRALSPALAARKEEIIERSEAIDRLDYFTMLGLERTATDADVETSYYAMVKTWHPDRLPSELANVRDAASKVFARITEAFQTLSDAPRRKRYLDVLKGGGGTPEEADKMQQIIDAATDFQRAEILWKNRDPNAEKFIVRAYHADSEQSDYIALYASLQLSKRPADAALDDLIKLCDHAIERNERCERAYFCRAQIKKRLGKTDSGMADFRTAFQLNPKNLDAGREVRLHEMRRAKQSDRRSSSAPRRSSPPGAPGKSNPPRVSSKPPRTSHSSQPAKKDKEGGMFSGIGKLFKR